MKAIYTEGVTKCFDGTNCKFIKGAIPHDYDLAKQTHSHNGVVAVYKYWDYQDIDCPHDNIITEHERGDKCCTAYCEECGIELETDMSVVEYYAD